MKFRLAALLLAPTLLACPPNSAIQHLDGGDGGLPVGAFNIYTLDTRVLPDGGPGYLVSTVPQLAIAVAPDDTLGIAFFSVHGFDTSTPPRTLYDIRYMSWKNGVASPSESVRGPVVNVDGIALTYLQPSNQAVAAYFGGSYNSSAAPDGGSPYWVQAQAEVAFQDAGGGWNTEVAVLNSGQAVCYNPDGVTPNTFSNSGIVVGIDPSLVVLPNRQVQLAYRDVHYGQSTGGNDCDYCKSDLEVATGTLGSWAHNPVNCGGPYGLAYGGHTQMIIGGDSYAAVVQDLEPAEADTDGQQVVFMKQNTDGVTWSAPATEPFWDLGQGVLNNTMSGPTLAYDPQIGYAVAVFNLSNDTLYYTESTTPLTQWKASDPVIGLGSQGWYPSLAIDPKLHQPSIAYYFCSSQGGKTEGNCLPSENALRLATRIGTQWTFQVVDPAGGVMPRLAYLSTGKRVIVYRNPFTGYLKLAVEK